MSLADNFKRFVAMKKKLDVYVAIESCEVKELVAYMTKVSDEGFTITLGEGVWEDFHERQATFTFLLDTDGIFRENTILNQITGWLAKHSEERAIAYSVCNVNGGVMLVPGKLQPAEAKTLGEYIKDQLDAEQEQAEINRAAFRDKIEADNSLRLSEKYKAIWARHNEVCREQQEKSQINPGLRENPINHEPGHDDHLGTGYSGHPRV